MLMLLNSSGSCFRQINAYPLTCQKWSHSTLAVPCLVCSLQLKNCSVEQVFPAELQLNSPTLFLSSFTRSTKSPNSALSAMLFEQGRYKQCSYQRTRLSPVFMPALLAPTIELPTYSAFQDRWRVAECGCWDNFSSWEPCQDALPLL